MKQLLLSLAFGLAILVTAQANDITVRITGDLPSVQVTTADGPVIIQRIQDPAHELTGEFAKTSRPCPPFCIQPMQVAPGVTTVGEVELLDLHSNGRALLIDARTEDWHLRETIPGAVNIPYTLVAQRLNELGCTRANETWNCSNAKLVVLFCNGIWCGQSPIAIRAMLREGYPAERIYYYRGGMQSWKILGFNTVEGSL